MIPEDHKLMLETISEKLKTDRRIAGIAVGGSYCEQDMDEFSDLDLVVAVNPEDYDQVLSDRMHIVGSLGNLLSAFTGEHVGEPRLIISLYEENGILIHVDFKFVSLDVLSLRVENPVILWEKDHCISNQFLKREARFPDLSYQWIEDRFWVWIHYGTLKIGRGELFETIEFISFLRQNVIGPLMLVKRNLLPKGVRKIEMYQGEDIETLKETVASYSAESCIRALEKLIELYLQLRDELYPGNIQWGIAAQEKTLLYLEQIKLKAM